MPSALREKYPNTELFLVRIFPHSDWIRSLSVFSQNAGKYGPEITPYLDTFHAVQCIEIYTIFPLYWGFTPLGNSSRIDLLLPFKTNNKAWFSYRVAFTVQRFWKCCKIYRINFGRKTLRSKMKTANLTDFLTVLVFTCKKRNISKAHKFN